MDDKGYTYLGLPSFAGLGTLDEVRKEGLSVEENVARLKRFHYAFKRLHQTLTGHITAEPIYELKMAYSHHAYLCAEHVAALRKRVAEMREPPLGLEDAPDPNLEIFFDEIQSAPGSYPRVAGIYGTALPALKAALEAHIAATNPLADAPTVRLLRFALLELDDMLVYGQAAIARLQEAVDRRALALDPGGGSVADVDAWLGYLDELLAAAGRLDCSRAAMGIALPRRYSAKPYRYDPIPRRDERFKDLYNMGVNAEAFLYDERYPARAKTLMMYYKRLREIDVPEMMASILAETPGKPWEYYRDMSRQVWDEARHAMMGEAGFLALGLDWPSLASINFTWSLALNTQLKPWERHAVLYFIEQGLMNRTGKRYEWEVAYESGDELARLFQDYDWADEVLHARIGQDLYVSGMPSRAEAIRYGDECWSKVFMSWRDYQDQGLTDHENWWPRLYRAACEKWGIPPDPQVLAFNESYEVKRADLKEINA